MGRVLQISISQGGVPKLPVESARIGVEGLEGDKQRNLKVHGGPDRAVCIFPVERIRELQAQGHPIYPGSTGENLTLEGIDWSAVMEGSKFRVGAEVLLEVVKYCSPCQNIAGSFLEGDFLLASQKVHPGGSRVYARVLKTGLVRAGDPVEHLPAKR